MKKALAIIILSVAGMQLGCSMFDSTVDGVSDIFGTGDTATVIAKTAQIRTSYAVVAADLLEVKRGERLDVLVRRSRCSWVWCHP